MMMKELEKLEKIAQPSEKGAKPSFNYVELIRMIRIIGLRKIVSRKVITEELRIGEGSVRTMIKRLKRKGFITTIKSGAILTKKGEKIFNILNSVIIYENKLESEKLGKLSLSKENYCIILKNLITKVKSGVEERDIALKFGSEALLSIIYKDGKFMFPDGYILNYEYKEACEYLSNFTKEIKEALIIISFSNNEKGAINGSYAVVWNLLKTTLK
jgi:DNA-binding MarR family transcriptional regulator